ncbi:MAG: dockerin type I repeat-containing protein [Gemmatimonadota bacterium]|nr:dockerin type I repeat-containing protein [Gemmatimonadota bacterium]
MRKTMVRWGVSALVAALVLAGVAAVGLEGRSSSIETGPAGGNRPHSVTEKGIAAKYLGDAGIENDSAVIFCENFESGYINDLGGRWTSISNKNEEVLALVKEAPPVSLGKRSLRMTATKGDNTGGHLWKLLETGYDKLYARFYVKFAEDHPYIHHFVHMGARIKSPNYPIGGAGYRPQGNVSFSTGIELGSRNESDPPGAWHFYTYWCEMRSYKTPEGVGTTCYGNPFGPAELEQAPRNKWQCVEFMIKCNSAPDTHDGEQAFWIDGRPVARFAPGIPVGTWMRDKFHITGVFNTDPQPFEGFRWRTSNDLKINTFWLLYYMASVFQQDMKPANTDIPYNSDKGQVWFDDIVLATEYIGPIASDEPDSGQSGCDFNGDGQVTVADVIKLLLIQRDDPQDMWTDYNGDGKANILDAVALLIDIMTGNCS